MAVTLAEPTAVTQLLDCLWDSDWCSVHMHLKNELMILEKSHLDYAKSAPFMYMWAPRPGQSGAVFCLSPVWQSSLLPSRRALQATPLAGLPPDTPAAGPARWPRPPTAPMAACLQGKAVSTAVEALGRPRVSSSWLPGYRLSLVPRGVWVPGPTGPGLRPNLSCVTLGRAANFCGRMSSFCWMSLRVLLALNTS